MTFQPICLEDTEALNSEELSAAWRAAKARLAVAAECYSFPPWISLDETAYVYKSPIHYLVSRGEEHDLGDIASALQGFQASATKVNNWDEALHVLFPWFHEGEEYNEAYDG